MSEIKEGEYVRTVDGEIGIFVRYSKRPENSIYKSPFNCFIKLKGHKTSTQCCEEYIVNHSEDIADLIGYGDFINGKMCIDIEHYTRDDGTKGINFVCLGRSVLKENIKSIVTKEQFAQMEYKVEE